MSDKMDLCCVDYESEYYRQEKQIALLINEVEQIKKALVNVCLKLGDSK